MKLAALIIALSLSAHAWAGGSVAFPTATPRFFYLEPACIAAPGLPFGCTPFSSIIFPNCEQRMKYAVDLSYQYIEITVPDSLEDKLTAVASDITGCAEVTAADFQAGAKMVIP